MPGFVSESELAAYFRSASVFVAPLYDTVTDWARCPSKLFMYAAFGKPVVTAKVGEAIDLFDDLAFFCDCSSSQSMACAILGAGSRCSQERGSATARARLEYSLSGIC